MSYCRFSCENFKSDVYVYAHVHGGFAIHVADMRFKDGKPRTIDWSADPRSEAFKSNMRAYDASRAPIGLPYDGQIFRDATAADCRARLMDLRQTGYYVPEAAIKRLDVVITAEAKEAKRASRRRNRRSR